MSIGVEDLLPGAPWLMWRKDYAYQTQGDPLGQINAHRLRVNVFGHCWTFEWGNQVHERKDYEVSEEERW